MPQRTPMPKHQIIGIDPNSIAEHYQIQSGWYLIAIDDQPIIDLPDFQALSLPQHITLRLLTDAGEIDMSIRKQWGEPLGLQFSEDLMSPIHVCANQCIFCFEDQLPPGADHGLRQRDDDWRLSWIMGTFVTCTNLDEAEIQRVLHHRPTPLYISVHATDPKTRIQLLRNPNAGDILPLLMRLQNGGISFHTQLVICPGFNDGAVFTQSLNDLYQLSGCLSVGVVPVGLTAYQRCEALIPVSPQKARELIEEIEVFQAKALLEKGGRWVFAADELYLLAESDMPPEETYEDYPQLENGIGLLALFQREWEDALAKTPDAAAQPAIVATGVSAAPFLRRLIATLNHSERVRVIAIPNRYFGTTVTVAGLVTGQDMLAILPDTLASLPKSPRERILMPASMLREKNGIRVFLDNMSFEEVNTALCGQLNIVEVDGAAFFTALTKIG